MAENKTNDYQLTMTQVLANKNIANLMDSLHLTEKQKLQATSTALELSSSATLCKCDKFSLAKFCIETVKYEFSRPDCIYPVPYKQYVQVQIGYRGYKELAMRSKLYKEIDAVEVLECDKLHRNRITGRITVEFEEDVNKTINSKIIGYYAYAVGLDGELIGSIYWTKKQCEEHGYKYSKTYDDGPWKTNFSKMAQKTVLKQLCGQLPTTPDLQAAIKQDQLVFGGDGEEDSYMDNPLNEAPDYTDVEIDNETIDEEVQKKESTEDVGDFLKSIGYDIK